MTDLKRVDAIVAEILSAPHLQVTVRSGGWTVAITNTCKPAEVVVIASDDVDALIAKLKAAKADARAQFGAQ